MSVLRKEDSGPPELLDADLVAMAREGRREGRADAFATLLERHWETALRVTRRVLTDPEDVEDVLQEAALAAYLNLPSLVKADRFLGWFCGIVLNHCRMLARRQRRSPPTQPLAGSEPSVPSSIEELAEEKSLLAQVRIAVQTLPTGQKQAALLVYFDGLSTREAAAALDISTSALKTRLHRARQALRPVVDDSERPPISRKRERIRSMVELEVVDVHLRSRTTEEGHEVTNAVILLRERGGSRVLPIWIGEPEATGIALELQGIQPARPMAYHFTASLLEATGSQVQSVTVSKLVEDTFFATVSVKGSGRGGSVDVDARPSDAINLALRTSAPIFAEDGVMSQVSRKMRISDTERKGSAALLEHFQKLQELANASTTEGEEERIREAWKELGIEHDD